MKLTNTYITHTTGNTIWFHRSCQTLMVSWQSRCWQKVHIIIVANTSVHFGFVPYGEVVNFRESEQLSENESLQRIINCCWMFDECCSYATKILLEARSSRWQSGVICRLMQLIGVRKISAIVAGAPSEPDPRRVNISQVAILNHVWLASIWRI